MADKLTKQNIIDIVLIDSLFKDEDSHLGMVEHVSSMIHKKVKALGSYHTYNAMPSIVVNGLADGVYESIHLTITLKDKVKDLYQIKAVMDFNKNENASLISHITNLQTESQNNKYNR